MPPYVTITADLAHRIAELIRYAPDRHDIDDRFAICEYLTAQLNKESRR